MDMRITKRNRKNGIRLPAPKIDIVRIVGYTYLAWKSFVCESYGLESRIGFIVFVVIIITIHHSLSSFRVAVWCAKTWPMFTARWKPIAVRHVIYELMYWMTLSPCPDRGLPAIIIIICVCFVSSQRSQVIAYELRKIRKSLCWLFAAFSDSFSFYFLFLMGICHTAFRLNWFRPVACFFVSRLGEIVKLLSQNVRNINWFMHFHRHMDRNTLTHTHITATHLHIETDEVSGFSVARSQVDTFSSNAISMCSGSIYSIGLCFSFPMRMNLA